MPTTRWRSCCVLRYWKLTLLKEASPVDLGRFRASWQVGENAAPFAGSRLAIKAGNHATIPRRMGYITKRTLGNVYSVHNNLPYAEKLAIGAAGSGRTSETQLVR
jgi:hypothetical protein